MTKDNNKQQRDESTRPNSRPQSSSRYGEERSPRSARPRLNREMVDRAWESGAPVNHADYRTRPTNGQAPRNNWRNEQRLDTSSTSNGRKPYGQRSEASRDFERNSNRDQGPRSRSHGSGRNFDNPQGNDRRSSYSGRPDRSNEQRATPYGKNRAYSERPAFGEYEDNRGYRGRSTPPYERQRQGNEQFQRPTRQSEQGEHQQRNFGRASRPAPGFEQRERFSRNTGSDYVERPSRSRNFEQGNRSSNHFERGERPSNGFHRESHAPRSFERNERSPRNVGQRGSQNPRWQSRPGVQWNSSERQSTDFVRRAPQGARFEGDYEHFDAFEDQPPSDKDQANHAPHMKSSEEKHVTQLPNGRVLKGPRAVQRKNAQFWTEIEQNTETLVDPINAPPGQKEKLHPEEIEQSLPDQEAETSRKKKTQKASAVPRSRTRSASAVTRDKKPVSRKSSAKSTLPPENKTRPSQRGYKWPTNE